MLVDKQNELMSDLLSTVHQHGGDDVTWKPPIQENVFACLLRFKFKDSRFQAPGVNYKSTTVKTTTEGIT